MHIKRRSTLDNGMAGIVSTLCTAAQLNVLAQDIDNLPFAFISPLRAQNDRGHDREVVVRLVELRSVQTAVMLQYRQLWWSLSSSEVGGLVCRWWP